MSSKNKVKFNNKQPHKSFIIEQELINIYTNLREILTTNDLLKKFIIPKNIYDKNNFKKINIEFIINHIKEIIKIIMIDLKTLKEEKNQIENYIIKLENDKRKNIKEIFEKKNENEVYVHKMRKYLDINEQYEKLKIKVKFKKGKFLNDDKKENEIFILRQENSNLKKEINKLENKIKQYKTNKIINNNIIINSYDKKSKEKSYHKILNTSYSNKRINLFNKVKTKNRVIKDIKK